MKKTRFILPLTLLTMALTSCNFAIYFGDSSSSTRSSSSSEERSSSSVRSSSVRSSSSSSSSSVIHSSSSSEKTSKGGGPTDGKTELDVNYADYTEHNLYPIDSAPTIGSAKLLIVPIWFNDSKNFISESKMETVREDIGNAYFGTPESTGWHSVKSYYEEESKGRLSIEATLSEWAGPDASYKAYAPSDSGGNNTVDLVQGAVDWFFENHPEENRTDYDRDGDGYLDGVMLIYAAPNYVTLGYGSSSSVDSYSNLWAYCYWVQDKSLQSRTNPGVNTFFWASYDFMYGSNTAKSRTGKNYYFGNTEHANIDAHTFIHEMGHVFGAEDYYDYGPNSYSPAASFSMQDNNVGGHDPFSVMAFGWADPYIPTSPCSITISAFQKNHDLILLSPKFNSYGSPFDEYLLIELYTPTGLNKFDSDYVYQREDVRGPNKAGIRLWHVDARLAMCTGTDSYGYPIFPKSLTSDVTAGTYGITTAMSNTYDDESYGSVLGSSYYNYNLLQLIRNNTSVSHKNKNPLSASDLFLDGDTFSMSTYKKQFVNSGKLNSGSNLGWSFSVSISGSGENATATIELTKA